MAMTHHESIRRELATTSAGRPISAWLRAAGYREHFDDPVTLARAYAIEAVFTRGRKHVYADDLIAGSLRGLYAADATEVSDADRAAVRDIAAIYEHNDFLNNFDHFAGDYETFLAQGVDGTIARIDAAVARVRGAGVPTARHEGILPSQTPAGQQNVPLWPVQRGRDARDTKLTFLHAAGITMRAFSTMCQQYAAAAREAGLSEVADACAAVAHGPPKTFRQALQLIWLLYQAFLCEDRYAMALGRMDQYLFPYYQADLAAERLTHDGAVELLAATFIKFDERRHFAGGSDIVNIAIGGVDRDGRDATNALSYAILEAVGRAGVPGPNLSARLHAGSPPEFLPACLDVIGTGLGYPALMNDEINIAALLRVGYDLADARDYCMVGCIENFLPGLQPPWSDGRFNPPKFLEYVFGEGRDLLTGAHAGLPVALDSLTDMETFLAEYTRQMRHGAAAYMADFHAKNRKIDVRFREQPFLSCFCRDCIERGLDINDGGAVYPSVHGVAVMGIATVADSLAVVEELVFRQRKYTLRQLADALAADFEDLAAMRAQLRAVPKYGNNHPLPDRYAVWFLDTLYEMFSAYRTHDGGHIYIAVAANVQNISAGEVTAATPDGRGARRPLNDAASPTYQMDKNGPTAVVLSCVKPDYTKAACGTVVNQRFGREFFTDPAKKATLCSLIRTYFSLGGQEMQINAVGKDLLEDAMSHPENHPNLVVRVSGFSAYFTTLTPEVQRDILSRTTHS